MVELLIVYLVLSFPSGRLPDRVDRLLVAAMAAVVAVFFGLQLVVADHFSVPSPFTSCIDDCPANALFMLSGSRRSWTPSCARSVPCSSSS